MSEKELMEAAEARALEAEKNMVKAAEFGQDLLRQLGKSETIRTELEQEKYSLKLQLQNREASEKALQDELQELTKKISSLEKSQKCYKDMEKALEHEREEFSKKEEELLEKMALLKSDLSQAHERLAATTSLPESPNVSLIDPNLVCGLREEVDMLTEQVQFLKEDNTRLGAENEEMNHLSYSLRLQITELKASAEEQEEELASYRESMKQANDELKFMDPDSDDEDLKVEAVAAKGNSLFSEVEDRRHIAEDKLKKCQAKNEELKSLYENKCRQLNKLRLQNVQLMNINANASGKFDEALVDRLQFMLQSEKERNKDLMSRLAADIENDDLTKNMLKQSLVDAEKMSEMSKRMASLEKEIAQLKAQNCTLNMRLSEKKSASTAASAEKEKAKKSKKPEFIVEHIVFDKKGDENPDAKLMFKLDQGEDPKENLQPLKESTNSSSASGKKKVAFSTDIPEDEDDSVKSALVEKKRMPRPKVTHNQIIDGEEECRKMNEQCAQQ